MNILCLVSYILLDDTSFFWKSSSLGLQSEHQDVLGEILLADLTYPFESLMGRPLL